MACLSLLVLAGTVAAGAWAVKVFLAKFGAVLWPPAVAVLASFLLKPAVDALSKVAGISRFWACFAVFAGALLALAGVAVFLLPPLFSEAGRALGELPPALQRLSNYILKNFPWAGEFAAAKIWELKQYASSGAGLKSAVSAAGTAAGGVASLCSFAAAFALAPVYLFYILCADFDFYGFLEKRLAFADARLRDDVLFCVKNFCGATTAFFRGQICIALAMGVLMGSGLALCGVKFGFLLGFCAGLGNLIPYFGSIAGLCCVLPTALLQDGGGVLLCLASLGVFVFVQMLEGYVLTPKIMGGKTGLHPAVVMFSVFFWGIALDGILGMVLAIPLSAFVAALWRRFVEGKTL